MLLTEHSVNLMMMLYPFQRLQRLPGGSGGGPDHQTERQHLQRWGLLSNLGLLKTHVYIFLYIYQIQIQFYMKKNHDNHAGRLYQYVSFTSVVHVNRFIFILISIMLSKKYKKISRIQHFESNSFLLLLHCGCFIQENFKSSIFTN